MEGCLICGNDAQGFTTCVECVVQVYLDRGSTSEIDLMEYLKEHDRNRFDMLIEKYK